MRIFSYIVAGIAVVAAPILWTLVHRYTAAYQELDAQLPVATRSLVATGGWLPAGILGAIAILVILGASSNSKGLALVAAIMGLIGILAVVGITFLLLYLPMRQLQDALASDAASPRGKPAEQVGAARRLTACHSSCSPPLRFG